MENTTETKYKSYYNEELLKLIKDNIPENTYGDFTSLVYDILLRRAYSFDLDEKEIIRDAQKVLENIKTIRFANEDKFTSKHTMGHIYIKSKIVEINATLFEKTENFDKMFETLTHEIYHGMSAKKTEEGMSYTGLQFFDEEGNKKGTIFNEIFNEAAADLASYGRTSSDLKKFYHSTSGYSSISFIAPLLAATFGLAEKDLYKVGISSREELYTFLSSKLPKQDRASFCKKMDELEFQLEQMYKINKKTKENITDSDKDNMEEYLIGISNFINNIMYTIISNDKKTIHPLNQKDYEYRRDAAHTILDNVINNKFYLLKEDRKTKNFKKSK